MKTNWQTKKLSEIDDISFLRGNGLSKSHIDSSGESKCILYGELYTKYVHPVITDVISRTNHKGSVRSEIGDVLVPGTTTADAFGIAIARSLNEKGIILGGDINILRTRNKEIVSDYLSFFLNGPAKMELASYATGTNIMHLSNKKIQKIGIPYPAIDEQKRLVNILNTVFEKITKAKESAEKNLQNSEELFEAYLQSVFAKPKKDWEKRKLGEVCDFYNGKAHEKVIDASGTYIVVNSKFVSTNGEKYKKTKKILFPLIRDDIVMVMSDVPNGKTLAKCFVIDKDNTYSLNQRICAIRSNAFEAKFLYFQLNRHKYLLAFNNGENQTNLRKDDILNCPLFVPSRLEQRNIIAKLNALSIETKKLKKIYKQKLADLEELKKSILSKAFHAEL